MAKMIDKYNKQIKRTIGASLKKTPVRTGVQSEGEQDPYRTYKELMESGQQKQAIFSASDDKGNLFYIENGITVLLPYGELEKSAPGYSPEFSSYYLNMPVDVVVDRIDEENHQIYLKSGREEIDAETRRKIVVSELVKELSKGDRPTVMGRIISIRDKVAYVNILNLNILGVVRITNWQKAYVRRLEDVAHPGEWFEFQVVGSKKKKGRPTSFNLNRANLTKDPWEDVREEYLTEGTVLSVQCVERPSEKSYWWGLCESIPDIYIMGDYNNHGVVTVMEGVNYHCKVIKADREKHILKVVPFSVVNNQFATQGLIDYLKGKKKKEGDESNG